MPSLTALQKNIRRLMELEGISYRGLAQAAGIDQSSIGRILSGASTPRYSTISKIATVLRTTPALLMLDPDEQSKLFEQENSALPPKNVFIPKVPPQQGTIAGEYVPLIRVQDYSCRAAVADLPRKELMPLSITANYSPTECFAIKAENSALFPAVAEGDTVYFKFCDKQSNYEVKSGDVVLAKTEIGFLIGRLSKGIGENWLTFDNNNFPGTKPIKAESIEAKAVGLFHPF